MYSLLHVDSDVLVPLKFLWRHELDPHLLVRIGNRLLKLKIPSIWHDIVAKFLQLGRNGHTLALQLHHVQNKIDVFRRSRTFQKELHCLSTSNHEVVSSRAERLEQFQNV